MHNPVRPVREPVRIEIAQQQRRLKKHQARDPHRRRPAQHRQQLLRSNRLDQKKQKRRQKNARAKQQPNRPHAPTLSSPRNRNLTTQSARKNGCYHSRPLANVLEICSAGLPAGWCVGVPARDQKQNRPMHLREAIARVRARPWSCRNSASSKQK